MSYLAIPQALAQQLRGELLAAAPLEAGAFCLLDSMSVSGGSRLVLGPQLESEEPWSIQRRDLITPSGRMISAAVSAANTAGTGLAFIHSHPGAQSADLSPLDLQSTARLGEVTAELLDGPFASLVLSPTDWAGVLTREGGLSPIERIAVTGRDVTVHGARRPPTEATLDDRQLRALGQDAHRVLRSLRVAVVGAGGLGSPLAETLVRMGVGELYLIDHDVLDTLSNARRIFGVSRAETQRTPPRAKADAVAAHLSSLELAGAVRAIVGDVRDSEVQARLLEMDVIFSATDTHSSRAALAELAVRGAIPLIDVGVRVGVRAGGQLDALRIERRVQVPGGPCLWCMGVLDAERVRVESLPEAQRAQLTAEGYLTGGQDGPVPSVAALTVTGAGCAASALLAMIAGAFDIAPLAVGIDVVTMESAPLPRQERDTQCVCSRWRRAAV
jgi:hypothetical protein